MEGYIVSKLDEIKNIWDWDKANPLEAMSIDDLQWLIQQAERVEELEKENELLNRAHRTNIKIAECALDEKRRYKQALKSIYNDTFYESEHEWVSTIHVIRKRAEKALKEGEANDHN